MQKIKLRAKNKKGEWVCGYGLINNLLLIEYYIDDCVGIYGSVLIEIEPETVGRYTGRKDINGKEIYEGDIVRFDLVSVTGYGTVKWSDEELAWIVGDSRHYYLFGKATGVEVIGNIHDQNKQEASRKNLKNKNEVM